ncbi:hypothetical protein GQX73_g6954 [Xylaria multiplex]|uniref:Uncharacterized protein n=1 Tax=Xylaria multiplex TaxID=323545 RepID=A0A7C8ILG0_9PEZI|nr:hypothetical protein GQX73_g6954 [Xylaria multiplex]
MFGGFAPPQLSAEEIRQLEDEATWTVKQFITTAVVLYICTLILPTHAAPLPSVSNYHRQLPANGQPLPAPFVVEAVSSVF